MRRARDLSSRAAVSLAIACAVASPLAVHWFAGRTLVWFDTLMLYAPQRWIVDEALRAFRLPLWNPHSGAGMPFFADAIHGVLHPVSIVTAWLGTDRSADVLIGGYVTCAGLGAALLARDLGASRAGAAVAAFAYGTSGFVLSMAGNLVFLAGAGSLPFCVAGLRRFALDPRPAQLAFGVGAAAALALSGDAQALMVGGGLALALAWEAGGWRGAARAVGAGVVGLLVAGVQVVTSAANVPRTVRAEGTWTPTPETWAFEPWRLPELVMPGLLRGSDPSQDPVFEALAHPERWAGGGHPFPFVQSVFVGLVPMALAFMGLREGRRGRLLGLLALVLLWVALGPALGSDALLRHVPVWNVFRYSEKLVGPLTLVLGLLAGLGVDAVVERRARGWWLLAVAVALGLASIGICRLEVSALEPGVASMAEARVLRGTWHVLLAAVALGGWLLVRDRLAVAWAGSALAAVAWVGAAAASPAALHPGDPDSRLRSPGPAIESEAPGPRIVTPPSVAKIAREPGSNVVDAFAREYAAIGHPAYNVRSRLDSLSEYAGMAPTRLALLRVFFQERWPVAARRYAATHVVLESSLSVERIALHAAATNGATRVESPGAVDEIWAVPHRPWASFPSEVRVVEDMRAAGIETGRVFAESGAAVVVEASSWFGAAPGRVLSIERGLESLRIEAEADADATLVVADAWWPGWEATIDGLSVPIFPADVLVRAVRWPAGRHVLEMRYRPPEVRTGILVSVLGVALLAAWVALLRHPWSRRTNVPRRTLIDGTPGGVPGRS